VVVELEAMGEEGDKAFLTGLLLVRLAEYRRARGEVPDLVHLLVIEEAHRLLGNVPTQVSEETANPQGQAVETFSNLLSEIRAYGEGVIIADQIPARLAPDVMKNTNLKIAHRVVASDDREALAGAMAMDELQPRALTSLGVGEAVVFSGGDDAPLLVRVPPSKDRIAGPPPSDEKVAEHMGRWREQHSFDVLFRPRAFCPETCATQAACDAARILADHEYVQRTLSRVVLSTVDEPGSLDRLWDDLIGVIRARRPPLLDENDLLSSFAGHGSDWLATRRGDQAAWSYEDTREYRDNLRAVLLAKLVNGDAAEQIEAFRVTVRRLHVRRFEPYAACAVVCMQDPPLCLYRSAVAGLVVSERYQRAWLDADDDDMESKDNRRQRTWDVAQDAGYELVEFPQEDQPEEARTVLDAAARRVCMCFAQQMLANDTRKVPRTSRRAVARLVAEAGL
jgi:hypothetical protein